MEMIIEFQILYKYFSASILIDTSLNFQWKYRGRRDVLIETQFKRTLEHVF